MKKANTTKLAVIISALIIVLFGEKNRNLLTTDVEEDKQTPKEKVDKESRRATRIVSVISIIALTGTFTKQLVQLAGDIANAYSPQGIIYYSVLAFFTIGIASIGVIAYDIVQYIWSDIKRYDVTCDDKTLVDLDGKSDVRYQVLLAEFRWCISLLAICVMLLALISSIYGDKLQLLTMCLCLTVLCSIFILECIRKDKGALRKQVIFTLNCLSKFILSLVVALLLLVIINMNSISTAEVLFAENGEVTILNHSTSQDIELEIAVFDDKEETILEKKIGKEDILSCFGYKQVYFGSTESVNRDENVIKNIEFDYSYTLDLAKELDIDSSMLNQNYSLQIIIRAENRCIVVYNEFIVTNAMYRFAQNKVRKTY